jgi:hypothetical protein
MLMIKFGNTLLYQIYLTKVGYFHRISEPWHWFQVGYPTEDKYIRCIRHIRHTVGFESLGTGSRLDISDLGQIYPMHQIYPTTCRVPELWQPGPDGYV